MSKPSSVRTKENPRSVYVAKLWLRPTLLVRGSSRRIITMCAASADPRISDWSIVDDTSTASSSSRSSPTNNEATTDQTRSSNQTPN